MLLYGSAANCGGTLEHPIWSSKGMTHDEILVVSIGRLDPLLEARHEAMPGLDVGRNLGVMDLEEQPELASHRVPDLGDLIPGATDLDELLLGDRVLGLRLLGEERGLVEGGVLGIPRRTPGEVGLMLLALGMREVRALVGMKSET